MTFGQQLLNAQDKMIDEAPMPIIELRESIEQDIAKKLQAFVEKETKANPGKDFYIQVFMAKDFALETAIRMIMQARWTRPLPQCGHWVYKFDAAKDGIELLWVLPNEYICGHIVGNPQDYDSKLVEWVTKFQKGLLS